MSIEDKVVLITGAGQGIGRGIALPVGRRRRRHRHRRPQRGEDGARRRPRSARIGRKATTFVADVTDREQVYAAVEHAESALDGFDVMINNAGIAQVNPIADVIPEEVATILAVNVEGVLWGIQAARREVPAARARREDHQRVVDRRARRLRHAGGLLRDQVRRPGADPVRRQGIRERRHHGECVLPRSCRYRHVGDDRRTLRGVDRRTRRARPISQFVDGIALGRAQTPEDVAAFVSYLAGPDSDYMTGQAGLIDGGLVYR